VHPFKGDDPDKKGHPGPPGWGLDVGVTTPPWKKDLCSENLRYISEAQHMRRDAGVPDGIMNSTAYTRSQILWRTSELED